MCKHSYTSGSVVLKLAPFQDLSLHGDTLTIQQTFTYSCIGPTPVLGLMHCDAFPIT